MPHPRYRVTDADYRTIATIGIGFGSHNLIQEAIANECRCDVDDLEFEEETDSEGYWTGEEIARLDGAVVARVISE